MNPICKLLSLQVCRYFRNGLHRCRRWCQTQADRMTESFQFQSERCIIELLILSANIHFVPNLSTAQFCYYESQQSERFRWSAWQKQNVYSCNFFLTAFNVLKEKRKSAALVFFVFIVSLRGTNSRGDKGDYSTLNHLNRVRTVYVVTCCPIWQTSEIPDPLWFLTAVLETGHQPRMLLKIHMTSPVTPVTPVTKHIFSPYLLFLCVTYQSNGQAKLNIFLQM